MELKDNSLYILGSNAKLFIKRLLNTFYYVVCYKRNFIFINCWVEQWFGKLQQRNFGDELNVYLIEELTGRKVVNSNNVFLPFCEKYLVIGSLIEEFTTSDTIIWGSGAIEGGEKRIKSIPRNICSVRGRLSRNYLLNRGVVCPAVFGDPALLLPHIYNPIIKKKYKYGIIPHVCDIEDSKITNLKLLLGEDTLIISFKDYGDWHNVIDNIKSCDYILSSSLHGLIISDAYSVPNGWIKVSDKIQGGFFKYQDYFSGVNREFIMPLDLEQQYNIQDILELKERYKIISFDYRSLLKSCPIKISISL